MDLDLLLTILDGRQIDMDYKVPRGEWQRGYFEGYKNGICEAMNLIYSLREEAKKSETDEESEG